MKKFMCSHTLPAGEFTREQVCQIAEAGQKDPNVHGYRSFLNLTEGKGFCVWEAYDSDAIASWFTKMGIPYDSIVEVEYEGERGVIEDLTEHSAMAGVA